METLTLTKAELDRLLAFQRVRDGTLSQVDAAAALGLSERQVRRLVRAFAGAGAAGLLSKRRGKPPNNRIPPAVQAGILERYRGPYQGFGPTLLAQTLSEREGILVSRESLRKLLIESGLWTTKRRRRNVHPLRERRRCFGELVQMDGSPHDWFEGRGPRCTLLVAIDDATSRVTAARFDVAETTDGYFALVRAHIEAYGRFSAAYTDKHSIFRYSGTSANPNVTTQLQRAFQELEIELICANSPQAKGRVERANRTFQDRLIKTMRLDEIDSIDAGNAFLGGFIEDHNRRFAIMPASSDDAHRPNDFDLASILCRHEQRMLTRNLMFQIDDRYFKLIDPWSHANLVSGSRIDLRLHPGGALSAFHGTHILQAASAGNQLRNAPIVGSKDLNAHLDQSYLDRSHHPNKARNPAPTHPWRTPFRTP